MNKVFLPALFVLVVWGGFHPDASAKGPAKVKAAVLPVSLESGEAALADVMEKTAIEELNRVGLFRLTPPKTVKAKVAVLKRKKIFDANCHKSPRCIKAVGKQLASTVLFYLEISSTTDKTTITAQTNDVRSGKMIRSVSESCGVDKDEVARTARWAVRLASGPVITSAFKGKGKLKINSTVLDAEIILNGKSFGKRAGKVFTVGSGAFDIMVRKDGYQPFRDVVIVKPKAMQQISAVLEAIEKPIAAVQPPPEEKPVEPPPPLKKEEKPELPAWAIFETPKKAEPLAPQPPLKESPLMALPLTEKPSPAAEEKIEEKGEEGRPFWQTWWFWTIIGTAVAAGAGTTTYFLLSSGGTEPAGVGSAIIHWE